MLSSFCLLNHQHLASADFCLHGDTSGSFAISLACLLRCGCDEKIWMGKNNKYEIVYFVLYDVCLAYSGLAVINRAARKQNFLLFSYAFE